MIFTEDRIGVNKTEIIRQNCISGEITEDKGREIVVLGIVTIEDKGTMNTEDREIMNTEDTETMTTEARGRLTTEVKEIQNIEVTLNTGIIEKVTKT